MTACKDEPKTAPTSTALDQTQTLEAFISAIEASHLTKAHQLLHPDLKADWSLDDFQEDFNAIQKELIPHWSPNITEVATGPSPNGPYRKVSYRLEKKLNSRAHLEIMAMKNSGQNCVAQLKIHCPVETAPSQEIDALTKEFIQKIKDMQLDEAQLLFTEQAQHHYKPFILKSSQSALGSPSEKTQIQYLQVLINGTWYKAAELRNENKPHNHLEITFSNDSNQLLSLVFKTVLK